MDFNKTMVWINKTEGRDKFCKTIQYASRLINFFLKDKNKEWHARVNGLFVGMRDARKLFRLFKSLNEYHKILELLNKKSTDEVDRTLNIINRLGFLLYWLFDNLAILSSLKFLKRDPKPFNKTGMTFWFLALVAGLIQVIRNFLNIQKKETEISRAIEAKHEEASADAKIQLKDLKNKRKDAYLNLLKTLGDMITASQGSEIFPKLFKRNWNDGCIGAGGLTSALITSYQIYNQK